jgi:hypothetical protein
MTFPFQLHCVTWDRDLWNAIDCETDRRDEFEYSAQFAGSANADDLVVTVNCTCQSGEPCSVFLPRGKKLIGLSSPLYKKRDF